MIELGLQQGPVSLSCFSLLGFSLQQALVGSDSFVAAESMMDNQLYPFTQSTAYIGSSAKEGFSLWKKSKYFYSVPRTDLKCLFCKVGCQVPPATLLVLGR